MSDRPNLLLICTDHQTRDAMSAAGNPHLTTPALDQLAAQGVRFTQAYCPFPLCMPCRVSMMTGRMPHELGVKGNQATLDESLRADTLGRRLEAAGYDLAYAGKWHVESGTTPADHGFETLCPMADDLVADRCIQYLDGPRRRPFCLVASFDDPHNICQWARNQPLPWGPVSDVPIGQCPELPANFAIPPYEPTAIRHEVRSNAAVHPTVDWTPDRWRQYRHAFYRLVERVDLQIGRILDHLERLGLHRDTVVVFLSDHGDGNAAHQLNQKSFLYEEQVGVPLIIRGGGARSGQVDDEHLVSTGLDLLPTLLDFADVPCPENLRGRSLVPVVRGEADAPAWRDAVVAETRLYDTTEGRMLRTAAYKYVMYSWGLNREQLFDVRHDQGEMVNLAGSARYADILQAHRDRLRQELEHTDDPLRHQIPTDAPTRYGRPLPPADAQAGR